MLGVAPWGRSSLWGSESPCLGTCKSQSWALCQSMLREGMGSYILSRAVSSLCPGRSLPGKSHHSHVLGTGYNLMKAARISPWDPRPTTGRMDSLPQMAFCMHFHQDAARCSLLMKQGPPTWVGSTRCAY